MSSISRRAFIGLFTAATGAAVVAAPTAATLDAARRRPTVAAAADAPLPSSGAATTVIAAANTSLTEQGLYCYGTDYMSNRSKVNTLGTSVLRTSNTGLTAQSFTAMVTDGFDVMVTVTGARRENFSTDSAFVTAYLSLLDTVLTTYHPLGLRLVEVWNEPNFGMWTGATNTQKQALYGAVLVAAYDHIKANYPDVTVVGFGAGGASAAAPGFIKGVLTAVPAAANSFDVVSLHPYIDPVAPEKIAVTPVFSWSIASTVASIRQVVTKPMWFTEIGWQISKADGGRYDQTVSRCVSPTLAAAYRVRLYLLCMDLGVARLMHMYATDTDGYNGGFFAATDRPSALAVATTGRLLPNPTAVNPVVNGTGDTYVVKVSTAGGGTTIVAWSDSGNTATINTPTGTKVYDMLGALLSTTTEPTYTATLAATPIYLVAPAPSGAGGSCPAPRAAH